ncbi:MAG: DUF1577 domain-containing protein [Spirochaetota bacterium]
MLNYKERKKRFFEEIEKEDELYAILKEKLSKKPLKIKYDVEEREMTIGEFDNTTRTFNATTRQDYVPGKDGIIICSALLEKYYEAEFLVIDTPAPGLFRCKMHGGRRATTGRSDIRFKVKPGDVYATNFRVSKHTIDLSMFKLPTSIKVILDQFVAQSKSRYDFCEVGYFDHTDTVINQMKRTGNSFFIEDLNDTENHLPMSDEFIRISDLLDNEVAAYVHTNRERGYKSLMMVPIIYVTPNEQSIPFAYIKIISKERQLGLDDFIKIKEETFKLVDRIRDANTQYIDKRQDIVDISRGGTRLRIEDPELKKYLARARGFVFDIVFKLQQPITIYGEIRFTGLNDNNELMLGLSFAGNSSRKNQMQHLYAVLKPMEISYKKRLIEQIKKKQQQERM